MVRLQSGVVYVASRGSLVALDVYLVNVHPLWLLAHLRSVCTLDVERVDICTTGIQNVAVCPVQLDFTVFLLDCQCAEGERPLEVMTQRCRVSQRIGWCGQIPRIGSKGHHIVQCRVVGHVFQVVRVGDFR